MSTSGGSGVNAASIVGTGSLVLPVAAKTAAYAMTATDTFITCDPTSAAFTVTLPPAPATGRVVGVCRINTVTNNVTVQGAAGATINGQASLSLTSTDIAFLFVALGGNWNVLSLT